MAKSPKVVLITGAARRVGATIAQTLHEAGCHIVLHYRHSEREAKSLSLKFNKKRKHSAITLKADLSDLSHVENLVKQAAKEWGYLDVLINNASQFYKTPKGQVTEKGWDNLINTNLKTPFFLCQAAMPFLKKRKGSIVNICDIHGDRPMRDYSAYCISKAGLLMATKILAKEYAPSIRVNAVSPGEVMLPEGENMLTKEQKGKILNRVVLGRCGTPKDIANTVLYLVTLADYVTGTILTVDGGRSLTS